MKALTVRQPWAWAIIHGRKDIENRRRAPRYRGPLLIHAAARMVAAEWSTFANFVCEKKLGLMPSPEELKLGGVIGIVDLNKVVEHHKSPWFVGPYGLVLANPRALPFYACKGQLGMFNVDFPAFGNPEQAMSAEGEREDA